MRTFVGYTVFRNVFHQGNYAVDAGHYPDPRPGTVVPFPSEEWPGWESPIATNQSTPYIETVVPPFAAEDWPGLGDLVLAEIGDARLPRLDTMHTYGAFESLFKLCNRLLHRKKTARPGLVIFSAYLSLSHRDYLRKMYTLLEVADVYMKEEHVLLRVQVYKKTKRGHTLEQDLEGGDLTEYPVHYP